MSRTIQKPVPFLSEQTSQYLNAIWQTLPPDQHKLASGMCIGEQSKYLRWEITPKDVQSDTLELIQIFDPIRIHRGNSCTKSSDSRPRSCIACTTSK